MDRRGGARCETIYACNSACVYVFVSTAVLKAFLSQYATSSFDLNFHLNEANLFSVPCITPLCKHLLCLSFIGSIMKSTFTTLEV